MSLNNDTTQVVTGVLQIPTRKYQSENFEKIIIKGDVKKIGTQAFAECDNLSKLTIEDGVEEIGDKAFSYCEKITEIIIPASVKKIGKHAFFHCTSLKYVEVNSNTDSIPERCFEGCKSLEEVKLSSNISSIGEQAFCYCNSLKNVTFPESLTAIGNGAFKNCESLTSIVIPSSVRLIGVGCFAGCLSLKSLKINPGVQSIHDGAFSICQNLTSVELPDSVTELGNYMGKVFSGCLSLKYLKISANVFNVDNVAPNCPSLEKMVIFNGTGGLYFDTREASNTIVEYQGSSKQFFERGTLCRILGHAYGPLGVMIEGRLYKKDFSNFVFPSVVDTIPFFAYEASDIVNLTIEEGIKSIGDQAFNNSENLEVVNIPSTVSIICYGAFSNCTALKTINYNGSEDEWKKIKKEKDWDASSGKYSINFKN